jgi:hypothetical protein
MPQCSLKESSSNTTANIVKSATSSSVKSGCLNANHDELVEVPLAELNIADYLDPPMSTAISTPKNVDDSAMQHVPIVSGGQQRPSFSSKLANIFTKFVVKTPEKGSTISEGNYEDSNSRIINQTRPIVTSAVPTANPTMKEKLIALTKRRRNPVVSSKPARRLEFGMKIVLNSSPVRKHRKKKPILQPKSEQFKIQNDTTSKAPEYLAAHDAMATHMTSGSGSGSGILSKFMNEMLIQPNNQLGSPLDPLSLPDYQYKSTFMRQWGLNNSL